MKTSVKELRQIVREELEKTVRACPSCRGTGKQNSVRQHRTLKIRCITCGGHGIIDYTDAAKANEPKNVDEVYMKPHHMQGIRHGAEMRITIRQLRKLIRESLDAPKRLDVIEVQEYFPEAFEGLVSRLGDDPDAEGTVIHGMKFYYKDRTLFTRSWDASFPTLKWENEHWVEASYN